MPATGQRLAHVQGRRKVGVGWELEPCRDWGWFGSESTSGYPTPTRHVTVARQAGFFAKTSPQVFRSIFFSIPTRHELTLDQRTSNFQWQLKSYQWDPSVSIFLILVLRAHHVNILNL